MTGSEVDRNKKSPRKRLKWFLIVSLALNLLFVGVIGGAVWSRHNSSGFLKQLRVDLINSLPEQKRDEVTQLFLEFRLENRPKWRKMRKGWREVIEIFRQDQYDIKRLEPLLNELAQLQVNVTKSRHQFMFRLAEKLSPQERRKFIDIWLKKQKRLQRLFLKRKKVP